MRPAVVRGGEPRIVLQQPVELALHDVEDAGLVALDPHDGNSDALVLDSSGSGEHVRLYPTE